MISRDIYIIRWHVVVTIRWGAYKITPCSSAAVAACLKTFAEGKGVTLETSGSGPIVMSRKAEDTRY